MQKETASLGDNLLHISFAFGEPPAFADRKGTGSPRVRYVMQAPTSGLLRYHARVDSIGGVRSAAERVIE
jgi:hypothetical protein